MRSLLLPSFLALLLLLPFSVHGFVNFEVGPRRCHRLVHSEFISSSTGIGRYSCLNAQKKRRKNKKRSGSSVPEFQHKITYVFGQGPPSKPSAMAPEQESKTTMFNEEVEDLPPSAKTVAVALVDDECHEDEEAAILTEDEEVELVEALTEAKTQFLRDIRKENPPSSIPTASVFNTAPAATSVKVADKNDVIATLQKASRVGLEKQREEASRWTRLEAEVSEALLQAARDAQAAREYNPTGLSTEAVLARKQPKPPQEEARLAAKYAAIEDVGDRAYAILVDLCMVEPHETAETTEEEENNDNVC